MRWEGFEFFLIWQRWAKETKDQSGHWESSKNILCFLSQNAIGQCIFSGSGDRNDKRAGGTHRGVLHASEAARVGDVEEPVVQVVLAAVRQQHLGARHRHAVVVAPLVRRPEPALHRVERVVAQQMVSVWRCPCQVLVLGGRVVVHVAVRVLVHVVVREDVRVLHVGRREVGRLEVGCRRVAQALREAAGRRVELVERAVRGDQVPPLLQTRGKETRSSQILHFRWEWLKIYWSDFANQLSSPEIVWKCSVLTLYW